MKTTDKTEEVVDIIVDTVNNILKTKEQLVLAVPGGRSITSLFQDLKKREIQWHKVQVFLVDERLVNINDSHSNFKLIKELLFNELIGQGKIPEENLHPFVLDSGIDNYNLELKKYGGKIDIAILGVGEDCHIGGLFPAHSIKREEEGYIIVKETPKPPQGRMTVSRKLLSKIELGVFLFIGEGKAEAYEWFQDKTLHINECPAKIAYELKNAVVLRKE